jgi:TRAP-type C4-dicarboxylate transport system substrate-binding protein
MKSRLISRGRRGSVVAVAVAAALTLAACGSSDGSGSEGSGSEDTITLRLAHYMPTTHQIAQDGIEVWMQEVEERTDGQVEFDYYPAGQLVSAEEMFSSLRSGVVDIGAFVPASAASAELPLSDVPTVPGFDLPNAQVAQAAYWDLLNGALYEEEWQEQEIRPVMGVVTGLYQLVMTGEPRRTLQDWRGSTVRTAGGVLDFVIEGIGGAPVNIPGPEEYEALQRGTVDSAVNTIESIPVYDFNEVLDAATTNAPIGASLVVLAISDQAWGGLPEDVQTAMQEASEVAQGSIAESLAEQLVSAQEETSNDVEYYELTDDELAQYEPALQDAQERWIKQREDSGHAGQELVDAWGEALEAAKTGSS